MFLESGGIKVNILGLPAIGTLSRIESGRKSSGIQTDLANQGRDYSSAIYSPGPGQIIVHYDFLCVWEVLFSGNPYC